MHPKQTVLIPKPCKLLTVQVQDDRPMLWALVHDVNAPKAEVNLRMYGTGHQHEEIYGHYISTFQLNSGALVFHMFEEI